MKAEIEMTDYLVTNISISLIALIALIMLKHSPARLRFYVALTSLIAWLVPWHLVSTITILSDSIRPINEDMLNTVLWLDNNELAQTGINNASITPSDLSLIDIIKKTTHMLLTDVSVIIIASIIGAILFMKDIMNYRSQLKRWISNSREDNGLWIKHGLEKQIVPIRLSDECSLGMATGLIKPIVWLNPHYQNDAKTKTILTHELNHILQNDPKWMWLLAFIQRLLWWNPLVHILSNIAREQIELSCDEKCDEQLKENYTRDLVEIFLTESKSSKKQLAAVTIKHGKNFNIRRLKTLDKEHHMKSKYLVVLSIALGMSGFVAAAVSYQELGSPKSAEDGKVKQTQKASHGLYRDNSLYNEFVDELLQITQEAKSKDPETIDNILNELGEWNSVRKTVVVELAGHINKG
jgi:beta-lactamase regulating signal transducer with metallopeptidase domain